MDCELRTFKMVRHSDESGVSGTGTVLEGVVFSDGKVVIHWICGPVHSTTLYNDLNEMKGVHVHSHPTNRTVIYFSDGEIWEQEDG